LLVGSLYTILWGKSKESKTDDVADDNEKDEHKKSSELPGRATTYYGRGDLAVGRVVCPPGAGAAGQSSSVLER
jgi:hypothetical protein